MLIIIASALWALGGRTITMCCSRGLKTPTPRLPSPQRKRAIELFAMKSKQHVSEYKRDLIRLEEQLKKVVPRVKEAGATWHERPLVSPSHASSAPCLGGRED